jgi:hypothetical protein
VPFVGLAEAYALAAFRQAGVPMQRIRPAIDALHRELGLQYALARQPLFTDGAVRNNQRVFANVVAHYLRRVDFAADG